MIEAFSIFQVSFSFIFIVGKNEVCRILIDKYDKLAMLSRSFLVGSTTRWPDATVPYLISSDFSSEDVSKIKQGMATIEGSSCVKFVERTNEDKYVNIVTGGGGCYANLGYNKWRSNSMDQGSITHELFHILGSGHEQNRPDRDEYVTVNWANVPTQSANNWIRTCNINGGDTDFSDCYSGYRTTTFGLPYEYGSVMHYGLNAGSSNGGPVMTTKKTVPEGIRIGKVDRPTVLDFKKLNKAYPCDKKVTTPEPTEAPCEDFYSNCADNVSYCATNQQLQSGCKRTCGICDGIVPTTPTPPCKDKYNNCGDFKSNCNSWEIMKTGCKVTCDLC
ncbi:Metalloendopeptidase [Caligus rogercresseyi]|uniref:Metalloendopeptidase n=1 Tax=Caligus rogercresseyi TaxID=217165 RepID=A0A7T8KII2_CALRO|nr:Metalloendopeptidase [Caligus rogercresseyi]